jgi:hypothetical protein
VKRTHDCAKEDSNDLEGLYGPSNSEKIRIINQVGLEVHSLVYSYNKTKFESFLSVPENALLIDHYLRVQERAIDLIKSQIERGPLNQDLVVSPKKFISFAKAES